MPDYKDYRCTLTVLVEDIQKGTIERIVLGYLAVIEDVERVEVATDAI